MIAPDYHAMHDDELNKMGYKKLRSIGSTMPPAPGRDVTWPIGQFGNNAECIDWIKRGIWSPRWDAMIAEKAEKKAAKATPSPGPVDEETIPFDFTPPAPVVVEAAPVVEILPEEDLGYVPTVEFSTFKNKTDTRAKRENLDVDGIISLFAKHQVSRDKDVKMFTPAALQGKRGNAYFNKAHAACFDLEHGGLTPEQVLELFPGVFCCWYTTFSHSPDDPRYRVVVLLSRPVDAEEHARLVLGIKSVLTPKLTAGLDLTSLERARAHYLPSCPPERKQYAVADHQTGAPLDVDHYLALGDAVAAMVAEQKPAPAPVDDQHHAPAPLTFEHVNPATGEVIDLRTWAAQNPAFDIVGAISPQYRRGNPVDGRQHITCPFEHEHTDQGADLATFAANASPPKFSAWDVHCLHAHCQGRDRLDYLLAMLEKGWITIDQLHLPTAAPAVIEMRRPPRVYYPVNDVLSAPEWSTLMPDERRIGLDLMTTMWAEDDGTIADDDWMIARRLGIPERDWIPYRATLTRTGCLVALNGRLTITLAKREFDSAQNAYMAAIIGGKMGGKKSAAMRNSATPPSTPP